jgi:hypothetical protein
MLRRQWRLSNQVHDNRGGGLRGRDRQRRRHDVATALVVGGLCSAFDWLAFGGPARCLVVGGALVLRGRGEMVVETRLIVGGVRRARRRGPRWRCNHVEYGVCREIHESPAALACPQAR